jgi:Na+/H+-dicarboxylate symporter
MKSLNTRILIGALFGLLVGLALNHSGSGVPYRGPIVSLLSIVGGVFIDLLKMVVIPLIFTCVVSGAGNLGGQREAGRIGRYTLLFYLVTMILAATVGLSLINLFQPGKGVDTQFLQSTLSSAKIAQSLSVDDFFKSFLHGLFVNPFKSLAEASILPTVVFALILGFAMSQLGDQARALKTLIDELLRVMLLLIDWIMQLAPVGVFALLAQLLATQDGTLIKHLGLFMMVIIGATLIQGLVVLPGLLWLFTRKHPWAFFKGIQEAMVTAFSTCSSAATLAIALKVSKEKLNVSPEIAHFVLPLGATVNSDGTALYEAGAALFVANLVGMDLSLSQQMIVCLMSVIAAIGAPGLPSAGMVTMIMVLQSVGLPIEAVAILLPMDRLIDTVRTAVNVEGDLVGAVVIDHYVKPAAESIHRVA